MLKIIGIVAVSWTALSVLFVLFVWPPVLRRLNSSLRSCEANDKTPPPARGGVERRPEQTPKEL
jgi:hypothetical protein